MYVCHTQAVCACAVSVLIPRLVGNLSPKMHSPNLISYKTRTFRL